MEYIPVTMILEDLCDLRSYPLANGYRIRRFRPGDEKLWADIEAEAGEFDNPSEALNRFEREFGAFLEDMQERCVLLETEEGHGIGTAMAWHGTPFQHPDTDAHPAEFGRLHWVGIRPAFHGRGLSKPLVGVAMARLSECHDRAYLTTQTTSWIAIKVYVDFGFVPLLSTPGWEEAWALIAEVTQRPELERFLA